MQKVTILNTCSLASHSVGVISAITIPESEGLREAHNKNVVRSIVNCSGHRNSPSIIDTEKSNNYSNTVQKVAIF